MKKEAAAIPMVRWMAENGHCLILGGDKTKLIEEMNEHLNKAENGEVTELIVHVEGGTTNGNMIKFQKGVFFGNTSVRPKAVKYNTYGFVSPSSGILDGFAHHLLICSTPFVIIDLYDMPIFRPNDYLY